MTELSDCHQSSVQVVGGDEGTNHWECLECGQPCNAWEKDITSIPQTKKDSEESDLGVSSANPIIPEDVNKRGIPPEGCTCASFWTLRQTHKADCLLALSVEQQIIELLGLERQFNGQLIPKDFYDFQSDWQSTVKQLQALIASSNREARIEENQIRLDKIIEWENRKPIPGELTTASFGSASGAMEVAGFKSSFETRIATLKAEKKQGDKK